MPFDPAHFIERFFSSFNPESRFYWPAVYALLLALVVHVIWYNWRRRGTIPPPESVVKPWAFWVNVIFVIWTGVLLIAKAPFFMIAISVLANIALVVYMYEFWLPPQEAAWQREQRRRAYFPQPKKKRRR